MSLEAGRASTHDAQRGVVEVENQDEVLVASHAAPTITAAEDQGVTAPVVAVTESTTQSEGPSFQANDDSTTGDVPPLETGDALQPTPRRRGPKPKVQSGETPGLSADTPAKPGRRRRSGVQTETREGQAHPTINEGGGVQTTAEESVSGAATSPVTGQRGGRSSRKPEQVETQVTTPGLPVAYWDNNISTSARIDHSARTPVDLADPLKIYSSLAAATLSSHVYSNPVDSVHAGSKYMHIMQTQFSILSRYDSDDNVSSPTSVLEYVGLVPPLRKGASQNVHDLLRQALRTLSLHPDRLTPFFNPSALVRQPQQLENTETDAMTAGSGTQELCHESPREPLPSLYPQKEHLPTLAMLVDYRGRHFPINDIYTTIGAIDARETLTPDMPDIAFLRPGLAVAGIESSAATAGEPFPRAALAYDFAARVFNILVERGPVMVVYPPSSLPGSEREVIFARQPETRVALQHGSLIIFPRTTSGAQSLSRSSSSMDIPAFASQLDFSDAYLFLLPENVRISQPSELQSEVAVLGKRRSRPSPVAPLFASVLPSTNSDKESSANVRPPFADGANAFLDVEREVVQLFIQPSEEFSTPLSITKGVIDREVGKLSDAIQIKLYTAISSSSVGVERDEGQEIMIQSLNPALDSIMNLVSGKTSSSEEHRGKKAVQLIPTHSADELRVPQEPLALDVILNATREGSSGLHVECDTATHDRFRRSIVQTAAVLPPVAESSYSFFVLDRPALEPTRPSSDLQRRPNPAQDDTVTPLPVAPLVPWESSLVDRVQGSLATHGPYRLASVIAAVFDGHDARCLGEVMLLIQQIILEMCVLSRHPAARIVAFLSLVATGTPLFPPVRDAIVHESLLKLTEPAQPCAALTNDGRVYAEESSDPQSRTEKYTRSWLSRLSVLSVAGAIHIQAKDLIAQTQSSSPLSLTGLFDSLPMLLLDIPWEPLYSPETRSALLDMFPHLAHGPLRTSDQGEEALPAPLPGWGPLDDAALLIGIAKYGYSSFNAIIGDPAVRSLLGLTAHLTVTRTARMVSQQLDHSGQDEPDPALRRAFVMALQSAAETWSLSFMGERVNHSEFLYYLKSDPSQVQRASIGTHNVLTLIARAHHLARLVIGHASQVSLESLIRVSCAIPKTVLTDEDLRRALPSNALTSFQIQSQDLDEALSGTFPDLKASEAEEVTAQEFASHDLTLIEGKSSPALKPTKTAVFRPIDMLDLSGFLIVRYAPSSDQSPFGLPIVQLGIDIPQVTTIPKDNDLPFAPTRETSFSLPPALSAARSLNHWPPSATCSLGRFASPADIHSSKHLVAPFHRLPNQQQNQMAKGCFRILTFENGSLQINQYMVEPSRLTASRSAAEPDCVSPSVVAEDSHGRLVVVWGSALRAIFINALSCFGVVRKGQVLSWKLHTAYIIRVFTLLSHHASSEFARMWGDNLDEASVVFARLASEESESVVQAWYSSLDQAFEALQSVISEVVLHPGGPKFSEHVRIPTLQEVMSLGLWCDASGCGEKDNPVCSLLLPECLGDAARDFSESMHLRLSRVESMLGLETTQDISGFQESPANPSTRSYSLLVRCIIAQRLLFFATLREIVLPGLRNVVPNDWLGAYPELESDSEWTEVWSKFGLSTACANAVESGQLDVVIVHAVSHLGLTTQAAQFVATILILIDLLHDDSPGPVDTRSVFSSPKLDRPFPSLSHVEEAVWTGPRSTPSQVAKLSQCFTQLCHQAMCPPLPTSFFWFFPESSPIHRRLDAFSDLLARHSLQASVRRLVEPGAPLAPSQLLQRLTSLLGSSLCVYFGESAENIAYLPWTHVSLPVVERPLHAGILHIPDYLIPERCIADTNHHSILPTTMLSELALVSEAPAPDLVAYMRAESAHDEALIPALVGAPSHRELTREVVGKLLNHKATNASLEDALAAVLIHPNEIDADNSVVLNVTQADYAAELSRAFGAVTCQPLHKPSPSPLLFEPLCSAGMNPALTLIWTTPTNPLDAVLRLNLPSTRTPQSQLVAIQLDHSLHSYHLPQIMDPGLILLSLPAAASLNEPTDFSQLHAWIGYTALRYFQSPVYATRLAAYKCFVTTRECPFTSKPLAVFNIVCEDLPAFVVSASTPALAWKFMIDTILRQSRTPSTALVGWPILHNAALLAEPGPFKAGLLTMAAQRDIQAFVTTARSLAGTTVRPNDISCTHFLSPPLKLTPAQEEVGWALFGMNHPKLQCMLDNRFDPLRATAYLYTV